MDLQLQTFNGKKAGNITVSDTFLDREFNESLVHQVVTAYLAGGRAGTHAQKTRSEVSGGGRKPFAQKVVVVHVLVPSAVHYGVAVV